MGIVINQSIRNTIITYIGFAIGAANALFMYPALLGKTYYGLTAFILSTANIMMPLMAFGVHNTLVKFYSGYNSERERSQFLSFMLVLPLLMVIPISLIGYFFYVEIATMLSQENPIIYDFVWQIPVIGLFMGYYEIFYAWVKVHMKSVFGNFVKEVLLRILITLFLLAVYLEILSPVGFIYATVGIYFVTTIAMVFFALRIRRPVLTLKFPDDKRNVFIYSIFIILAGSVATLLLDIDKFMIGQYIKVEQVAIYSVAIFIATVIAVPSRAMHQITYPITARLMSEKKHDELNSLYKKSSVSLQIIGGYVLIGILINIKELYKLLPGEYGGGIFVVFAIGISKYMELMLGNNNAIIFNSRYYRIVLMLGLMLAAVAIALNMILIPKYGIDGAAMATLIAITLYSFTKLMFVVTRMKLFPFTRKTLYCLLVALLSFVCFYYWEFQYSPMINIFLKSLLMSAVYGYLTYKLRLSEDVNQVLDKIFIRFRNP